MHALHRFHPARAFAVTVIAAVLAIIITLAITGSLSGLGSGSTASGGSGSAAAGRGPVAASGSSVVRMTPNPFSKHPLTEGNPLTAPIAPPGWHGGRG